jgi:hypothetical protein
MKNISSVYIFLLTISIIMAPAFGSAIETPKTLLASIRISDGISKHEASSIAKAYFITYVGCGTYTGISERKDVWIVNGVHGRGAALIEGFFIDKKSGEITSPIGPSHINPYGMLNRP